MRELLIFCLLILAANCVLQTSMYRRDNYRQQVIRDERWDEFRKLNQMLIKRFQTPTIGEFVSSSQPFYDYADQEYNIRILIGTPPQMFEVIPETSTANTWVIDKSCNGSFDECPVFCQTTHDYCISHCKPICCNNSTTLGSDPCANKRQFDQSISSTYQEDGRDFLLSFGIGNVTGTLGIDTITLGDPKLSQVKIPNTTFGQAKQLADEFSKIPLDGMLGLAYKAASVDDIQPVFQHGIDLGLFEYPVFTIWLASNGIDSRDKESGSLSFGSMDSENCAKGNSPIPVLSQTIWSIEVDGLGENGHRRKDKKRAAVISLGSSMILLSEDDLMYLVDASGAYYDFQYGLFVINCKADFSWSIYVGGEEFRVENKNLIWTLDNGIRLLAAGTWGDALHSVDLILGVPLLRQFCTHFNVQDGQIIFAKKINNL